MESQSIATAQWGCYSMLLITDDTFLKCKNAGAVAQEKGVLFALITKVLICWVAHHPVYIPS